MSAEQGGRAWWGWLWAGCGAVGERREAEHGGVSWGRGWLGAGGGSGRKSSEAKHCGVA